MSAFGRLSLGVYRGFVRARDKMFSLSVGGAFARFGSHTVIQMPARIVGERRISLGSGVFVGSASWLQTLGDAEGIAIVLEDDVSIAGHCVISAAESIHIGRGASIARGTYIADHIHAYDDPETPIAQQGITQIVPVHIGAGAWIGENVVIGPGATVGSGSVVGANSVVAGEIPPYSLALGVPARVIRRFGPKETAAETTEAPT
jgi:acetyltransferase-like isoleucine patch superfamily enzyme